jgi:hypothetical protein
MAILVPSQELAHFPMYYNMGTAIQIQEGVTPLIQGICIFLGCYYSYITCNHVSESIPKPLVNWM